MVCFHVFQVQTDYEQVTQNQFLFNIVDADSINHVVVFLTGQTPFPDGYGGAGELHCKMNQPLFV